MSKAVKILQDSGLVSSGIPLPVTVIGGVPASSLTGVVDIPHGGTGEVTATTAFNALEPDQSGNSGKVLTTDGTDTSWAIISEAVEQDFTSQTSVLVTHNFGNFPVVQVLGSSDEVLIPLTIIHASVNAFTVTFTSSTTGKIIATYGNPASVFNSVTSVSDTYTVLASDDTVKCTGSLSFTVNLPAASGIEGQKYNIKHVGSGTITVDPNSSELIDGVTSIVINSGTLGAFPSMSIQSDNSGWMIL